MLIGIRLIRKITCWRWNVKIRDVEIKQLLQQALVDEINSREVFMTGIDISYYYEGFIEYDIEDL